MSANTGSIGKCDGAQQFYQLSFFPVKSGLFKSQIAGKTKTAGSGYSNFFSVLLLL